MAVEHIDSLCFGRTPIPVIEAYVNMASQTKAWIEGLGGVPKTTHFLTVRYPQITHPSWPNFPGSAAMVNQTVMSPRDDMPNGERLFGLLREHVEKRGIKPITGAPAKELLTNDKGEVIGAIFDGNIHSLGGDFYFDPMLNRAVSVSTAAITEALTNIYGQNALVLELTGR